jgi:hypothetical protein
MPSCKATAKKGDAFYLIKLPDFGWDITLPENVSPDDPIILFIIYYTPEIIEIIVQNTNDYVRMPRDDPYPYARANQCVTNAHVTRGP